MNIPYRGCPEDDRMMDRTPIGVDEHGHVYADRPDEPDEVDEPRPSILPVGTRIYYTGDCANVDGYGTIQEVQPGRWGTFYAILMEDGRTMNISVTMVGTTYEGHGNPRFYTAQAVQEWKQRRIEESERLALRFQRRQV